MQVGDWSRQSAISKSTSFGSARRGKLYRGPVCFVCLRVTEWKSRFSLPVGGDPRQEASGSRMRIDI